MASIPCTCEGNHNCPVCYGHGTVLLPYTPNSTLGRPLDLKVRRAVLHALCESDGSIDARRAFAKRAGVSNHTLVRALKGGTISFATAYKIEQARMPSAQIETGNERCMLQFLQILPGGAMEFSLHLWADLAVDGKVRPVEKKINIVIQPEAIP